MTRRAIRYNVAMTTYIALLRAVNVGGTGNLPTELKSMCIAAGFTRVATYITSGNVGFDSKAGSSATVLTLVDDPKPSSANLAEANMKSSRLLL